MSGAAEWPRARRALHLWALVAAPLIYGAAFPPWKLAWAAWVGLVPWCVALRVARTRTALLLACASTLLGSYVCTTWLPSAVANYYQQPLALGLLLFAGVYAVTVAPSVIAFTLCYRWLARRPSVWLPLLAGAAWAASEVGRVRLAGNPFGLFGYSQVDLTPLVQVADVTGVFAVSGILVAVNAALAELWLAYRRGPEPVHGISVCTPSQAWRGVGLIAAALAVTTGYGLARMRAFDGQRAGAPTPIAIVQANLDTGSQWRRELYGVNFEAYVRLTAQALHGERPRLVFWPESAMTFFLEDVPAYRAGLARLLAPAGAELVAGGPRADRGAAARYYNAVFLVAPDGGIVATYDKRRLLPFAEYFPFGGSALLRRQFARVREFTPGAPSPPLPTAAGAAGVLICNEAMFGEIAAERARAGASYLATLTNDSWLGDRKFDEQALDMARLRAIEQRRYLVRASTSGPSAIVDPLGRVTARTEADTAATVAGTIHAATGLTFYARHGDLFGVLCAAALVCTAVVRRATAARAPSGHRRGA